MLSNLILERSSTTVILFGTSVQNKAQLLFQSSSDLNLDLRGLMQKTCTTIDGRGGGKAHKAQGGGPSTDRLEQALAVAEKEIIATMKG